jgi:cytochrome c oxidase subunit 1
MADEMALPAVEDQADLPVLGRLHEWVVTVDHKRLGLMYIGGGLFFFVIAGLQAVTIRLQLAFPYNHLVPPQVFNRLMTMHGTAMVFLVGMAP